MSCGNETIMATCGRSCSHQNDGFTIVEVLIAVAVTAILAMGLGLALPQATRLLGKTRAVHRDSRQTLLLDDLLRREVGRLRIPFWEGQSPIDTETELETLILPFVDGKRERGLRIGFSDGRVKLSRREGEVEEEIASAGPFEAATWHWIEEAPTRISGIDLEVRMLEQGRVVGMFIPASSHPFLVER